MTNKFSDDPILSLSEALNHAKGKGAPLTQAQIAPLMGISVSGYQKWEQGKRSISDPAAAKAYVPTLVSH